MEEFYEIMRYLPASYKSEKDGEYIVYLRDSFEQNYQNEKYQFALLASHMLYMSFVYFSVWQIKNSRPDDFAKSLIGFSKDDEKELLEASNPFTFWKVSEARIFRFLKLVGCENEDIGKFSKLVQQRNDIAHPNGIIHCTDQTREILIHANYFSEKDIEACLSFDISEFEGCQDYDEIREIYALFKTTYLIEEEI